MPHQGVPAVLAIGDSHTFNEAYGLVLAQFYPARVVAALNAAGGDYTAFNYGVNGETTTQMVARVAAIAADGAPEIAIIYGGSNDSAAVPTVDNLIDLVEAFGSLRTIIVGNHYANTTTPGDTPSAQWATWRRLRLLQKEAASRSGARYVDTHRFMRKLILADPELQGDDLYWHVNVNNRHLNAVGEQLVADAITQKIIALRW